ncbi:11485_t:CDS:1 [Funneliformis caledonium]|uniref:11485_t:CDS:1 n=1 Tax=Funneliformis caledonium TaxID=1117310 RepID=A0A9N9AQX0_9GLOM|nr:11485_t:CDS:1 [Funneliformis caledonium]
MNACLSFVSMLKKTPAIEKKPEQAVSFRTLVPQDFAEEDTSCSASSSEINQNHSRFSSLSRKKDALPPVTSRVTSLLYEAESKATARDFAKSVELLEKATTLGSACAAAKLGLVYHGGLNSTVNPDYASAAAYYFLALKLIYMIPNNKWDMSLLLDVIAGLSEIYRKQMCRTEDIDIWNTGIKAMRHIESTLSDPSMTKFFTHRDNQKCKAARIHMNFCLAMTAEADGEFNDALNLYGTCKRIGECNFATADKLVKKAHTKIRILERQVPKVKPVCVSCDFEPKELSDIWKLLVCSKCQVVAACSRECLTAHLATHTKAEK